MADQWEELSADQTRRINDAIIIMDCIESLINTTIREEEDKSDVQILRIVPHQELRPKSYINRIINGNTTRKDFFNQIDIRSYLKKK